MLKNSIENRQHQIAGVKKSRHHIFIIIVLLSMENARITVRTFQKKLKDSFPIVSAFCVLQKKNLSKHLILPVKSKCFFCSRLRIML